MRFFIALIVFFGIVFSGFAKLPESFQTQIREIARHDFHLSKNESLLEILLEKGSIEWRGNDKDIRSAFVTIQAVVEQAVLQSLKKGEMVEFVGSIHTPSPTTALCTQGGMRQPLVLKEVAQDLDTIATMQKRVHTLRELLQNRAVLLIVYPEQGFFKRTEEQRQVYQKELANFPDTLIDFAIEKDIPRDLIGATYLFEDSEGKKYVFSIQATQANDVQEGFPWKLWLDQIDSEECSKRIQRVDQFLVENTGLSLKDAL